jgi:phosphopantothenoylcysteine decarboxylase/phosphopantothenate--cysteine ligase
MLKGKHILLGITGSIAAYKAATLVRLLTKAGAEVKVLMTPMAKQFITPLTMATLSKHPILVDFYNPENGDWNNHVSLGEWSDYYLIAPATANTLAKMATGTADNLVLTTYLSARCPVIVAPAMDFAMFNHPATQHNLAILRNNGVTVIQPGSGELASGLEGKGRMEEPENIIACLEQQEQLSSKKKTLAEHKILITAGPTYETIDAVRFIGNYSSGKMGYALAEEVALRGGKVTLISGPTHLPAPANSNIKLVPVTSADEMRCASEKAFEQATIAICCAAVADFTPEETIAGKIKRGKNKLQLQLKPTTDIAATLGKKKKTGQYVIGFALETDDEIANAKKKMQSKKLDFIALNSLNDKGVGFGVDTNKITLLYKDGQQKNFKLKAKSEVAKDIVNAIECLMTNKK